MPGKSYNDDIYYRNHKEPHRMREAEAVQLINDEEAEDEQLNVFDS